MPRWIRWLVSTVVVVATLGSMWMLLFEIMLEPEQTFFGPNGRIVIASPGPAHLALPAVACIWNEGLSYRVPDTVIPQVAEVSESWVVCRIPKAGAAVPIVVGDGNYQLQNPSAIHAFLRSIPGGYPACATKAANVVEVMNSEDTSLFQHLCSSADPPPQSEWARYVPPGGDASQPVPVMRIELGVHHY